MIKRIATLIFTTALILCLSACESGTAAPSGTQEQAEEAPSVPVLLYLPGENAIGFITETALTDGTPEHIVSLLVREEALPEGSALLDFVIDGKLQPAKAGEFSSGAFQPFAQDANGDRRATTDRSCRADMNAAYGQALGKGTSAEYQLIGCLVNTLLTYFDLEEITLTIEGETLETGHNVYDYPLRFFE